jgi:hypothetical protein
MWIPQAGPQLAAIEADWCDELFYGGERGGGKSDFQLGYQEDGALRYGSRHRGIVFRKTYAELEELQGRAMAIFPAEGAVYKTQPSAGYPFSNCWYWPTGASVKMRYIENERDYGRYHGHQYTRVSFDEVPEYASPAPLLKMFSTLRSPYGVPCSVRATGNPGGVGHVWAKARYVDVAPERVPYLDPSTGFTRMYIRAPMASNRQLLDNDPKYRSRIMAATEGNEALRKAWLEGDWDIVAGAYFENWRSAMHVVPRFTPPKHWTRGRSMDWGSARPFSIGWWVVAEAEWVQMADGSERKFPAGALIRYREWYGCERDEGGNPLPNTGLRLDAEVVAKGIKQRELGETINEQMSPADPSMWKVDGGPSIAERMAKIDNGNGPRFKPADNSRVQGWQQLRARLNGEDGIPMLYVTDDCRDFRRTFPALQNDPHKIEDVDSDGEDHAGDDARYMAMARPWSTVKRPRVHTGPKEWSLDWVIQQDERRRRDAAR